MSAKSRAAAAAEASAARPRALAFVIGALTEHWGMKIVALLLAVVVFIVTRDEVTRTFTVPLRVVSDPERVLLTTPPETVEVRLRGPWVNVNQIAADELGAALLDLREARPGPMEIDPASVVMPRGVVLEGLDYDPVDLRFEALVERRLAIEPTLAGTVDADYLLGEIQVDPASVVARARASILDEIAALRTEPVELGGISERVERTVELAEIPPGVQLLGYEDGQAPELRLSVELIPVIGEIDLRVETGDALREALGADRPDLPETERISVRGPRALLRELDGIAAPLRPRVELPEAGSSLGGGVTLRFDWSSELDEGLTEQLTIAPPVIRLRLGSGRDVEPAPDD